MSLKHSNNYTKHSLQRLIERSQFTHVNTIKKASKAGYPINCFKKYPNFYKWLSSIAPYKRVKVYKGLIFIFNNTSDRCITVYPIKDRYLLDYNDYINKKGEINEKRQRRFR